MKKATMFKGAGYLVSTGSVILLGIVSWKSASEKPLLLTALLIGMATSVGGMCLRWISHLHEQAEKRAEQGQ